MITTKDIDAVSKGHVLDSDGDKVGPVDQVYLDNNTGEPEWVTVKTGMFGGKATFVPLAKATIAGEDLRVPFAKAKIKDAPRVEADGDLSPAEEDELYTYYGMTSPQGTPAQTPVAAPAGSPNAGREDLTGKPGIVGKDTSGPTTDGAMTRSEEQVNVGTEKVQTGTAKLRKYVVTEQQSTTVPVSHQEVKVTREPITEANRGEAMAGGELSSEEHEVTLHAEKAVVDKEVVPVERIKLDTDTVRREETVNTEVRKEQIEVDDEQTPRTQR
jgi:uncharacterized protein (TIGR02271 family)